MGHLTVNNWSTKIGLEAGPTGARSNRSSQHWHNHLPATGTEFLPRVTALVGRLVLFCLVHFIRRVQTHFPSTLFKIKPLAICNAVGSSKISLMLPWCQEPFLDGSLVEIMLDECIYANSEFDFVIEGFDRIARGFLPKLKDDVIYRARVSEIKQDEHGVSVK